MMGQGQGLVTMVMVMAALDDGQTMRGNLYIPSSMMDRLCVEIITELDDGQTMRRNLQKSVYRARRWTDSA